MKHCSVGWKRKFRENYYEPSSLGYVITLIALISLRLEKLFYQINLIKISIIPERLCSSERILV